RQGCLWPRFPRIRGDRPQAELAAKAEARFPPHTRGSTADRPAELQAAAVSPAYAGIDPRRRDVCVHARGFPRIRGDRPDLPGSGHPTCTFPPHTRGSTFRTYTV